MAAKYKLVMELQQEGLQLMFEETQLRLTETKQRQKKTEMMATVDDLRDGANAVYA